MRYLGWILGGLFTVDGLTALVGGRKMLKWSERAIGRKLPRKARRVFHLDDTTTRAWGVNNLLTGLGLVLVATLAPRRA